MVSDAGSKGGCSAASRSAAVIAALARRSFQLPRSWSRKRSATRAKPSGRMACTCQRWMPQARTSCCGISVSTHWRPASARHRAMALATPWLKTRIALRHQPLRKVSAVESASMRPSRAAIAPPSMPTSSVRCWASVVEPEMPVEKRRSTTSETGKNTIPARARASTRFSSCASSVSSGPRGGCSASGRSATSSGALIVRTGRAAWRGARPWLPSSRAARAASRAPRRRARPAPACRAAWDRPAGRSRARPGPPRVWA